MKKGTIIGISVVLTLIIAFFVTYKCEIKKRDELNAMLNETYDNAISAGGEMLKAEYPDLFNEETDFIGYELNGIWHVQNYVRREEDAESIRYVKFKDENFDEILLFGNLQTQDSEVDPKCEVENFDEVILILIQITNYKLDYIETRSEYYKRKYENSIEIIGEYIPYMINVRNKDGIILNFEYVGC